MRGCFFPDFTWILIPQTELGIGSTKRQKIHGFAIKWTAIVNYFRMVIPIRQDKQNF